MAFQAQDLSADFTEVDDAGDYIDIDTDPSKCDVTAQPRGLNNYVYRDYGANYFGLNFKFRQEVYVGSGTAASNFNYGWGVANVLDCMKKIDTDLGNALYLRTLNNAGTLVVTLIENNGGSENNASFASASFDTPYYIEIERDEDVGTYGTLYARQYSDSGYTSLIETVSVTLTQKIDFRYLYAHSTFNAGSGNTFTGYYDNLLIFNDVPAIDVGSTLSLQGADTGTFIQYNFTNFTEVDGNTSIAVTSSTITVTDMTLDEVSYVHKDQTWHDCGSFRGRVKTKVTAATKTNENPRGIVTGYTNVLNDYNRWSRDGWFLEWVYDGTNYYLNLVVAGATYDVHSLQLSVSTDYWVELRRYGTYVKAFIFDADTYALGDCVGILKVSSLGVFDTFTTLYNAASLDINEPSDTISYEVSNSSREEFSIVKAVDMARFLSATIKEDFEVDFGVLTAAEPGSSAVTISTEQAFPNSGGTKSAKFVGTATDAASLTDSFTASTVNNYMGVLRVYPTALATDDQFTVMRIWKSGGDQLAVVLVNDGGTLRFGLHHHNGTTWQTEQLADSLKTFSLNAWIDIKLHMYIDTNLNLARYAGITVDGDIVHAIDANAAGIGGQLVDNIMIGGDTDGVRNTEHTVYVDDFWFNKRNVPRTATLAKNANGVQMAALRVSWPHGYDASQLDYQLMKQDPDEDNWSLVTTFATQVEPVRGGRISLHEASGNMYYYGPEIDVGNDKNGFLYKTTNADGDDPWNLVETVTPENRSMNGTLPLSDTISFGGGSFRDPADPGNEKSYAAELDTSTDTLTLGTLIHTTGDFEANGDTTEQRDLIHYSSGDIIKFFRMRGGASGNTTLMTTSDDEGVTWSSLTSMLSIWGNVGGGMNWQYIEDKLLMTGRLTTPITSVNADGEVSAVNLIAICDRDTYEVINSFIWWQRTWGGDTSNGDVTTAGVDEDGNFIVDMIAGSGTAMFFRLEIPITKTDVLGSLSLMGVGR